MSEQVKWLSVSKINVATTCPKRYKLRYIDKLPEPSVGALLSGRVVHSILEFALRGVLNGGSLPSAQDMDDLFLSTWARRVEEEEAKPEFVGWTWDEDDPEDLVRSESRGVVKLAREEVLPTIRPKLVEHDFYIDTPVEEGDEKTFRTYGVIDLFTQEGMLVDWKVVQKVSANAKKLDLQFPAYSIYVRQFLNDDVVPARKIFLVRGKSKKVERVDYRITPKHRANFIEVAREVWRMTQHGGFVPNPNGWWCSPRWCSFYDICQGDVES